MSDSEASFLPGPISMKSMHRAFPSLSQKLDLREHLATIKPDLDKIEERLRFQVQDFDPGISGYVSYALDSNGKRIRPALVLLAAHASGKSTPQHIDLAVVVELIHLATLVHDDIMDGASKRRGKPTAFAKWGAEISVLLGDCLFCHALKLSAAFEDRSIMRSIADASNEVCSGEMLQTQRRFDLKLSIPEYIKIISMKTGALFRISTELAAVVNGSIRDAFLPMISTLHHAHAIGEAVLAHLSRQAIDLGGPHSNKHRLHCRNRGKGAQRMNQNRSAQQFRELLGRQRGRMASRHPGATPRGRKDHKYPHKQRSISAWRRVAEKRLAKVWVAEKR